MTTINIDFVNTQPTPDAGWNNADIDPTSTGVVIADLLGSSGENTGLSLEITSAFSGRANWGSSSWPDGPQHGWPTEVWRDQWSTNGTATLKISGFDAGQTGTINIAGAGVHDNRDTDYNVTGGAVTRYNNSGDLKNPSAPVQLNFTANESGEIFVDAAVVVTFGYLTGLSLTFEPDTFDLSVLAARALDGARNSAFPDGPTITVGDASLGLYTWGALAELEDLIVHTDGQENFGSGPDLSKMLYDEFDESTDGQQVDAATTLGENWDSAGPNAKALSPHSGSFCAKGVEADLRTFISKNFSPAITEFFLAYAIRVPDGSFFPEATAEESFTASSALKVAWLLGPDSVTNDMVISSWSDGVDFTLSGNDITWTLDVVQQSEWAWDTWNYWSCWLQADPNNPATVNGNAWFQAIMEGVGQVIQEDNANPIFQGAVDGDGADWDSINIIGWHRIQNERVDRAWRVDDSAGTFVNETDDVMSAQGADVQPFPFGEGVDDYFALGKERQFSDIDVDIATPGEGAYTVTWEYWDGTNWIALANVTDNTNSFKASTVTHRVTFDVPVDWTARTLNGSTNLFYVRARRDAGTVTTDPILDDVRMFIQADKDKTNIDIDSIYMAWDANAAARIVLSDDPDRALALRAPVCPHTSWGASRVVAPLRKVSHAGFSGLHVLLIKADNSTIYIGQLPS